MKKFPLTILIILLSQLIFSQISHGGKALSFTHKTKLKSVAVFNVPSFNYNKMIAEDLALSKHKSNRYGKVHNVNLNPDNSGTWQNLNNGDKIWQLKIKSKGAYSLSLVFNNYQLKNNAKIFVYSANKKHIIGAFTEQNNKSTHWFSTIPIAGDEIVIELNTFGNNNYGKLNISAIIHDYKGVMGLKTGYGAAASCNVNINCEQGLDWQIEKKAIVTLYAIGHYCTGTLINNTAKDTKPYLLTASHCVQSQLGAQGGVYSFNYESKDCKSSSEPIKQSISGANLVSTGGGNLDFTLLELSEQPPNDYDVYFAGWNRKPQYADTPFVCIHHPQGDIKKISFTHDTIIIDNYGEGYKDNSHYKVKEWQLGTTEGGSSGSPLFDKNHLIIGDLSGGDARCGYNYNDFYSRFDLSWNYFEEPKKQLKTWLDPLNLGVEQLEGLFPNNTSSGLDIAIYNNAAFKSKYCSINTITAKFTLKNSCKSIINNAIIKAEINNKTVYQKKWEGVLKPSEQTEISFEIDGKILGESTIIVKVLLPNNEKDINDKNNSVSKTIIVSKAIDKVIIEGNNNICRGNILQKYMVKNLSNYKWAVSNNAKIIGNNHSSNIDVEWQAGNNHAAVDISNTHNNQQANIAVNTNKHISKINPNVNKNTYSSKLQQMYNTDSEIQYTWKITGGEIIEDNNNQQVDVKWNEWGERKLYVNVSNYCNSKDTSISINVVEQYLVLKMNIENNNSQICWYVTNCDGDTIASDCNLPKQGAYTSNICLSAGCYNFIITNKAAVINDYELRRVNDNQVVLQNTGDINNTHVKFIANTIEKANINIYPNPSKSEITIEAHFVELYNNSEFGIFDMSGKTIIPYKNFDTRKTIDISALRRGIYIVKLKTEYGETAKKFIKQ